MNNPRWVIVAQLSQEAHTPTVYGTWETAAAAQQQLARWERRIERTFGGDPGMAVVMSVEPLGDKTAAEFERDFHARTGRELAR